MKKKLFSKLSILLLLAGGLSLSSCLKDSRYVDFSKVGTIVEFPLGGQVFFGADAITETPGTDALGTIVRKFSVNVASPTVPSAATNITLAVDMSLVTQYNAAGGAVFYEQMPSDAYKFYVTTITIPGGQRTFIDSVAFYKNKLDPSKSYMLPIKIASAGGLNISANMGVHYYHFIGNDFAGAYEHFWDRWSTPDSTILAHKDHINVDAGPTIALPVTPNEFVVTSAYYTGIPMHVSFTKTGLGSAATYSNFNVFITNQDIQDYFIAPGQGVVLGQQPQIVPMNNVAYDPNKQYTYAQSLLLFRFYYLTGSRAVIDRYVKL
jgi:hypothetical protein